MVSAILLASTRLEKVRQAGTVTTETQQALATMTPAALAAATQQAVVAMTAAIQREVSLAVLQMPLPCTEAQQAPAHTTYPAFLVASDQQRAK